MHYDIGPHQHMVEVPGIAQIAFAHFTSKSGDQVSTIPAGCDNMQVFMADLYQLFEHMAANKAGCAGNEN
jgi:hypothetical protein